MEPWDSVARIKLDDRSLRPCGALLDLEGWVGICEREQGHSGQHSGLCWQPEESYATLLDWTDDSGT
jgi:hypothetical protein